MDKNECFYFLRYSQIYCGFNFIPSPCFEYYNTACYFYTSPGWNTKKKNGVSLRYLTSILTYIVYFQGWCVLGDYIIARWKYFDPGNGAKEEIRVIVILLSDAS